MRIKSVDGYEAVCEAKGIERSISLFTWATPSRK